MSIGYFLDKNHLPTEAEVTAALGSKKAVWDRLVSFMQEQYELQAELTYGGKNYGWNLWYRKAGKSLVSFYPHQEGLTAQVVLGGEQVAKAMELELGENVGRLLRDTPQLHDGKWLFIPVRNEQDAVDVERLVKLKRKKA